MFKNEIVLYRLYLLIILLVLQTGCNNTQFTPTAETTDGASNTFSTNEPPPNTGVVQQACESKTGHKVKNLDYFFPKPKETCDWGNNGNLEIRDGFFQGRIEQEQALTLENGAVICDIKFNFQRQQFLYDDHFIFSFNNAIIASSFNFKNQLTSSYGLLRYDWSRIAGMNWDKSMEGTLCAAGGQCSWPKTDIP